MPVQMREGIVSRGADAGPDTTARGHGPDAVLQNRAFLELSRVISAGEPAVLSSALPIVVRGAGVPSAAVFGRSHDEVVLLAAQGIPLKLRAYLEEPAFSGAPDFIARRALVQRHAVIDTDVFGSATTPGASTALEEAAWQSCIAVPVRVGGVVIAVIVAGARTGAASGSTVAFLEAAANLLGTALAKPSVPPPAPRAQDAMCPGCIGGALEALSTVGREVAAEHALVQIMCSRQDAPPESEELLARLRSLERAFRRLSEMLLRFPLKTCGHGARPSSMGSVVDAAVHAAGPALATARAQVEVVGSPACDFEADPEMIALALRHLLLNAAESFADAEVLAGMPSGRRRVRVCARYEGSCAVVHVEDSGPGVPVDLRARMFEPGVSTKGACRGLGLAVARHVVESHGGWMEVGASELGGTRISLHVPVRSAALEILRTATTVPRMPAVHVAKGARRER